MWYVQKGSSSPTSRIPCENVAARMSTGNGGVVRGDGDGSNGPGFDSCVVSVFYMEN